MFNQPGSGSFSSSSPEEAGTSRLAGIIGLAVGEVSRLLALGLDSTLSVSLLTWVTTLPVDWPPETAEALHAFIGPPLWLLSLPKKENIYINLQKTQTRKKKSHTCTFVAICTQGTIGLSLLLQCSRLF